MAAMKEDTIQHLVRELVSSEIRETAPSSSVQLDSSNNSARSPDNVVATFQNVNEELSSVQDLTFQDHDRRQLLFPPTAMLHAKMLLVSTLRQIMGAGSVKGNRVAIEYLHMPGNQGNRLPVQTRVQRLSSSTKTLSYYHVQA